MINNSNTNTIHNATTTTTNNNNTSINTTTNDNDNNVPRKSKPDQEGGGEHPTQSGRRAADERDPDPLYIHPVSITRFPLRRFSPGAGLLRNRFVHR